MLVNETADYGWTKDHIACSDDYLGPAVLKICRKLDVRSILDLGCGKGSISAMLAESGFDVMGCDADATGVQIAMETTPQAVFRHLGVYDDPGLLNRTDFDAVISTEVIEHLYAPRALPRFAGNVLKDGGYLIVTTPYHGYLKNLALALTNHWDRHLTPLWDGGHIKFFSRRTLTDLLEAEGFKVVIFKGVGRTPCLWKSMILVAEKVSNV